MLRERDLNLRPADLPYCRDAFRLQRRHHVRKLGLIRDRCLAARRIDCSADARAAPPQKSSAVTASAIPLGVAKIATAVAAKPSVEHTSPKKNAAAHEEHERDPPLEYKRHRRPGRYGRGVRSGEAKE